MRDWVPTRGEIRCGGAAVALFLALLRAPLAQTELQEGIVGLLKLPQLFGDVCREPPRLEVALYAEPQTADVVGWIRAGRQDSSDGECRAVLNVHRSDGSVRELPVEEYEEEEPKAAIVVEARGRWAKLRLGDDAAWIAVRRDDDYLSLQQLLLRRQAYLTEAWDHALAETPGGRRSVHGDPRRHLIAYVEPAVEGIDTGTEVRAFEAPDPRTAVVARFPMNECERKVRTLGGNPPEVAVFDRRPGWLQVSLRAEEWKDDRRVWIEDAPVWRLHTFASDAERAESEQKAFGRDDPTVRFIRSRTVAGTLWLYVEVLSHTIYESPEPPHVVARGWVPAHDAAGRPVVWFYSRD